MTTTQLPSAFGGDQATEAETEWRRVLEALQALVPTRLYVDVDNARSAMVIEAYDSGVMSGLGRLDVDPSMSLDQVIDACREALAAVVKVLGTVTA